MPEHWRRIPGTQKGSPFSLKGGRTKYKRQMRDKRVRDGDPPWGGSCEGEVFQTAGNSVTSGSVGSFGISEGNITGRKEKKKKPTEKAPNHNFQQSLGSATIEQRLDREVWVACLR